MIERRKCRNSCIHKTKRLHIPGVAFRVRNRLQLQHQRGLYYKENATNMRKDTPQFKQIQEINYNRILQSASSRTCYSCRFLLYYRM